MNDLSASQTFASDAGANTLSFDLTAQTVTTASKTPGDLAIHYDAAAKSYTVSLGGVSETFLPSNVTATTSNDTQYAVNTANGDDYLTLVSVPYDGTPTGQYVRMGYLQRNVITGSTQDTQFATFTFGLDTAAAAVPRIGSAGYQVDIFGLASTPGHEPRIFEGPGTFSTDFASGVFTEQSSSLTDYDLLTGGGIYGGGVFLNASGHLSASDGTFSGYVAFDGEYGQIPGTLTGGFYGPTAQEVGASFSGTSSTGGAMTGSFTGTSDPNATLPNFTIANLSQSQLFSTPSAELYLLTQTGSTEIYSASTYEGNGQLYAHGGGSFDFTPPTSNLPFGSFDNTDIVASSDPNFTAYRATLKDQYGNPQDASLELYKPGPANTELALTYMSFGHLTPSQVGTQIFDDYFVYGLDTQQFLMLGRTGTAQYNGVAYGSGANVSTGAEYDVTGTSHFDVDFSAQTMSGALDMHGAGRNGASSVDFGTYDFSGALSGYTLETSVPLTIGGTAAGTLTTRFFGPAGEEIGGPFTVVVPSGNPGAMTNIAGVALAKQ